MFLRKVNLLAAGLLAASIVGGVGWSLGSRFDTEARAQERPAAAKAAPRPAAGEIPNDPLPDKPASETPPAAKPPEVPANTTPLELMLPRKPARQHHPDEEKIIGTWQVVETTVGGNLRDPEEMRLLFGPFGTMIIQNSVALPKTAQNKAGIPLTYKLDPTADPPAIDLILGDKTQPGIYTIEGDSMEIFMRLKGSERPSGFTKKDADLVLFRLRREFATADTKWPEKMFTKGRSYDFGTVKAGERPTHKFVFKNIYDRPVSVASVEFMNAAPDRPGGTSGGAGPQPPMGASGFGPMGAGIGGGPMGQWTFGGGVSPIQCSPLPSGWIQPGDEDEIEVYADSNHSIGERKVILTVHFNAKRMDRRVTRSGQPEVPPAPMGGNRSGSAPGFFRPPPISSSTELTVRVNIEGAK